MATNVLKWNPGDPVPYNGGKDLTRYDFPDGFLFGGATASYQVEGAYDKDRRGVSNWDDWSLMHPGKVAEGGNGTLAIDHYNRVKEDIRLLKQTGLDTYRFSISWCRILPGGKFSTGVNPDGIKFYSDLIDLLIKEKIEPIVTIFHFEVPKCLGDEYGGFLNRRIVDDYAKYAEVCFQAFGDRVKIWTTINEPSTFTTLGYVNASFPPGHGTPPDELPHKVVLHRCHPDTDKTCHSTGNEATEPYIVAHHLILAHATAVRIYREKYQAVQGGKIGIVVVPNSWYFPYSDKKEDKEACERAIEFLLGWFVQPLVSGEYPESMQKRVKERLPKFSDKEKEMVTGSYDYIGLNYYTTMWARYRKKQPDDPINYHTDQEVEFLVISFSSYLNVYIYIQVGSEWLYFVPIGIYDLLTYAKRKYNDPVIYITENGCSEKNVKNLPIHLLLADDFRIKYHQEHLAYLKLAIDTARVNVKGYVVWSILDNYEWAAGYTVRFGMYFVDYLNGLNRYPKKSAIWYMNFLNKKKLMGPKDREVEDITEEAAGKKKRKY
ncbi:Beta-glucosidase 16 [Striga hermonthica]|uniref:Beta-glucosidase 16 n=1 Tax=Striga hermonthica TaxID=68872 RepID=A0A9N7MYU3_STRHE|nr:Beta-glucosidase 16 [Striga hermonthica]